MAGMGGKQTFEQVRVDMLGIKIALLLFIWGGAWFSAFSGQIRSARIDMDRSENPREWWYVYAWLTCLSVVATYLVLKL
jgi:hypothetical protein